MIKINNYYELASTYNDTYYFIKKNFMISQLCDI